MTRTNVATAMASMSMAISMAIFSGTAQAASYTFPTFNQVVDNSATAGLDPESKQLAGAPAGSYNAYTVSVNWSALAGDPYSAEAYWAFTDTNDLNTVSVFYADPGIARSGTDNGDPKTLTWTGYMDTSYSGGDPLHMLMAQDFEGSSANWNDVTVNIFSAARYTATFSGATDASAKWNRPSSLSSLSAVGTNVPYAVVPFFVDTTSDYLISNLFPDSDGYLVLYQDSFAANAQLTNILATVDDTFLGETESTTQQLVAGKQYYLVVTGYENIDFGPYSGSISSANPLSPGQATIGLVPEPASLTLALLSAGLWARRRRQSPVC